MSIVLAWFLVINSHHNTVTFSPPITTLAGCQVAQQAVDRMDRNGMRITRCIQMETWVQR
jgi:hypothetical protein